MTNGMAKPIRSFIFIKKKAFTLQMSITAMVNKF